MRNITFLTIITLFFQLPLYCGLLDSKKSILKTIENIDNDIVKIEKNIIKTRDQIKDIERNLKHRSKMVQKVSETRATVEQVIDRRIKYLSILLNKKGSSWFSDRGDFVETEKKKRFLKLVIKSDIQLLKEYIETLAEEQKLFIEKNSEKKKLLNKKDLLNKQQNSLKKQRLDKYKILKNIEKSIKLKRKFNKESIKVSKKLPLKKSSKKGLKVNKFLKYKGKFSYPVKSKVSKWYKVKYDKKTRTYDIHKGLTFIVPIGTSVYSIYGGDIVYSSYIKGYGKTIIISHGDGYYSIYMHLSKFLKNRGEKVKKGDKIGLTGDTGAALTPRLYFEIRFKRKPLNINKWFKK